jgi:hypothetical protein
MNYANLDALIDAKVYENTEQEVTGEGLNQVLKSIASSLKKGYLFGGMVSPSDPFTTGDERMVFVAAESGRYPSFGNFTVHDGEVCLFMWDTQWTKKVISYNNPDQVYGVRHYYGNSSPDLTRIGAASLHQDLPVQSLMRRCVVNDSGVVLYYLGENDSTKKEDGTSADLSGAVGQVMVEVPEHYRKTSLNAAQGYMDTEISLYPFDGAVRVPRYLISAYEASLDRENNVLSSVVNNTARYRGGNNTADWDGTYRSLLGMPATNISLTNFRTYAQNRGAKWGCNDWNMHMDIFWLFAIEYATLNSQKTFNPNLDAAGMHQGGLGAGVSNINSTSWGNYNSYNPFVPCGTTNSLGNKTGVVTLEFTEAQAEAYGSSFSTSVPSYRGIENPFGHIWKWTDGFLAKGMGDDAGYQEVYISRDRSQYASALNDSYVDMGHDASANGYVKAILASNASLSQDLRKYGDLIGTDDSGSASTYFCDYHYTAHALNTIYGACVGGNADNGAGDGLAYVFSDYTPSATSAYIGSRLSFSE